MQVCYIGELSSKSEGTCNCPRTEKTNDQLPPQTGDKNKIKPSLPTDSYNSKWIFPTITSCYSDRRQGDSLASRILWADIQRSILTHVTHSNAPCQFNINIHGASWRTGTTYILEN
ncbi:hypothetical protein AVEN_204429-1 [Araneus ventricosus]|uniref:Uncharacterized protein n=1 Tax=Araneus ventricosus TaxID=182803 RepID=A0A4Y2W6Y5_ARAVE|nr:hypothetical protein AVEN_204429-1 [Araneus ventricosus]